VQLGSKPPIESHETGSKSRRACWKFETVTASTCRRLFDAPTIGFLIVTRIPREQADTPMRLQVQTDIFQKGTNEPHSPQLSPPRVPTTLIRRLSASVQFFWWVLGNRWSPPRAPLQLMVARNIHPTLCGTQNTLNRRYARHSFMRAITYKNSELGTNISTKQHLRAIYNCDRLSTPNSNSNRH
jgi:hypothetical protein